MRKFAIAIALSTLCQIPIPEAHAKATVDDCNRISNKDRRRTCLQALVDAGRYESESHAARAKGYENAREILCVYDKAGRLISRFYPAGQAYRTARDAADLASRGASSCKAKDR